MWRPTVRYDEAFQAYVEELFKATTLDRNQIMRLALYSAPYSKLFLAQLNAHKRVDVALPFPTWNVFDHHYWRGKPVADDGRGGEDVNAAEKVEIISQPRRARKVHVEQPIRIKNAGGIKLTL